MSTLSERAAARQKVSLKPEDQAALKTAAAAEQKRLGDLAALEKQKEDRIKALDLIRAENVKKGQSTAAIDAAKAAVNAGSFDTADKIINENNWLKTTEAGKKLWTDLVNGGFKEELANPEVAQTVDNATIFGTGLISETWNKVSGFFSSLADPNDGYADTWGPTLLKVGGGLVGGLVAMRLLGGMLDNSLGKIPIIGGLLSGLLKIGILVLAGLGTANVMSNMGINGSAQSSSGGSHIDPAKTAEGKTATQTHGGSTPTTGDAPADDAEEPAPEDTASSESDDSIGDAVDYREGSDANSTMFVRTQNGSYYAGQTDSGRNIAYRDFERGRHVANDVDDGSDQYEMVGYRGGDMRMTAVRPSNDDYTPAPGFDRDVA